MAKPFSREGSHRTATFGAPNVAAFAAINADRDAADELRARMSPKQRDLFDREKYSSNAGDTRDMTSDEQRWEAWDRRLRDWRSKVVTLPRETTARPHDDNLDLLWREPNLFLAAGTRVRYVETRYDSMRLDEARHFVTVESGPNVGRWASIGDTVGPGPLPWEASAPWRE